MSLFTRIRWFKSPKYNIYVSRNIRIYALRRKTLFCFTNGRCLFPNDLHGSYIICTVECTFHLTKDVQSLKILYLLFAEIFLILKILFQSMWDYDVIRYLIYICQKPKYLENEIRFWETENAFLIYFIIIIY